MVADTFIQPKSNLAYQRGRKPTSGAQYLDQVFDQVKVFQDLLRFEHDPCGMDPAISVVQEYARAVRLLYIKTRWSRLGLSDWHSEMKILLSARESMCIGLDIWDPLDDFFDTYVFEMEVQPMSGTDARARELVKQGLLRQLQDTATREMEACHRNLCDLLGENLSNWRLLDSKLLAFKKKVWLDCEERGSLCLESTDKVTNVNMVSKPNNEVANTIKVDNTADQVTTSPTQAANTHGKYFSLLPRKPEETTFVHLQRDSYTSMIQTCT